MALSRLTPLIYRIGEQLILETFSLLEIVLAIMIAHHLDMSISIQIIKIV